MTDKVVRLLIEARTNIRYATGAHHHDPAVWVQEPNERGVLLCPPLDVGSKEREVNKHTRVLNYATLMQAHLSPDDIRTISQGGDIALAIWYLKHIGATTVEVPGSGNRSDDGFAADYADALRAAGFNVRFAFPFFPEREIKSEEEIAHITAAQRSNEKGFLRAFKILQEASIDANRHLVWQNAPLTAEILRAEMCKTIYADSQGVMTSDGPIIACGAQGADPHERGTGVLKADELIVIDCFPQLPSGYWGDLTRTVIKGTIAPWQQALYDTVLKATHMVEARVKAGVNGGDIQRDITDFFTASGYPTDMQVPHGFFHGVGHALGLGLHESPGINSRNHILQKGNVVTNEPGLYYNGYKGMVGGVRIEDILVVRKEGCDNLTRLPKFLDVDSIDLEAILL